MLKKEGLEIKRNYLEVGDRVWACAYDYNYNRLEKALIQMPVYGEIIKAKYGLHFCVLEKMESLERTE